MEPLYAESDHQAQKNANGILKQLRHSLQLLSLEAQEQNAHFPPPYFFVFTEEMVLDLDNWAGSIQTYWKLSQEQLTKLATLSNFLDTLSWPDNPPVGPDPALLTDPQWEHIRSLAKATLMAFEWPVEVPPPARWVNGMLVDGY